MRATARFWSLAAIPVVLTGWAVVLERPLPLVGVAGVAAWLLARQYAFARSVAWTTDHLSVTQRLSTDVVATDGDTYLTLTANTDTPLPVHLAVEASPPPAADTAIAPLSLDPGEDEVTWTTEVTWPVAGTYTFDAPMVTVRDGLGLFEQRFTRGSTPSITVEAPSTGEIHVGAGGDPVTVGYGEHESDRTGQGLEPAGVREYVPGDAVRQIDWKSTARLNETHVREFTAQSERETVLFVDHRAGMHDGPAGATKLDFARELALGIVGNARDASDPLGCYTVSDYGLTGLFEPRANVDHYERVRRHLLGIETVLASASKSATTTGAARRRIETRGPAADPARTRTIAARLRTDDSPMARELGPFLDQPNTVVRDIADRPLFSAVELVTSRLAGAPWTMVVADDSRRAELREAARVASQAGGPVLVFVTPTALYETGGLGDLDDAYARYADFETFRAGLDALDGVSAFEVGPADRLSTVLARRGTDRPTRAD